MTNVAPHRANPAGFRKWVLLAWLAVGLVWLPLLLDHLLHLRSSPMAWLVLLGMLLPLGILGGLLGLALRARVRRRRLPEAPPGPRWYHLAGILVAVLMSLLVGLPQLLSDRAPVRPTAARSHAVAAVWMMAETWNKAEVNGVAPQGRPALLEAAFIGEASQWRNPYSAEGPAFDGTLRCFTRLPDGDAFTKALEALAKEPGVVVGGYQLPDPDGPALVGAAVRCPGGGSGPEVYVKVHRLD